MSATVITVIGDQIVSEDADEHFARIATERHVLAMRHLARVERQRYLVDVERAEGSGAYYRLKAAFLIDWEKRRGQP